MAVVIWDKATKSQVYIWTHLWSSGTTTYGDCVRNRKAVGYGLELYTAFCIVLFYLLDVMLMKALAVYMQEKQF